MCSSWPSPTPIAGHCTGSGEAGNTSPIAMVLKKGLELLSEQDGGGTPVRRHFFYRIKLRMWLHRGEPVRWSDPWGLADKGAHLEDAGAVLLTDVRVDRVFLIAGLFYGIQGKIGRASCRERV